MSAVFLFSRFQTEETDSNSKNFSVANAKNWFENTNTSLDVLQYTELIDWNNATIINEEGRKAIEVSLVLTKNTYTNVVDDKEYQTFMRLLFIENQEGTYQVFVVDYTTKGKSFDKNKFNLYNLNTNNCSDFAQQISAAGGLNLPNTNGSWPGGGGTNPGNLGQDIRNMVLPSGASIKTTGGIALSNAN